MVLAVFVSDLCRYDPAALRWTHMSGLLTGPSPAPRKLPAFVSAGGRLYLFGGADSNESEEPRGQPC